MNYRHSQPGVVIIASMAFVTIIIMFLPIPAGLFLLALLIIAAALAQFYSLTIEITGNTLICSFGIGLIRRTIPLSEIQEAQTVQNPWFVGWGIRWVPGHYWVWNVSGFRAVELTFVGGKRFRLGTDEPEALVNAIHAAKAAGV